MARRSMLLLFAVAAFVATAAFGSGQLYVVTLKPVAAIDGMAAVAQQMIASYGGSVVEGAHRTDGVVLRLDESQARLYAADPRVQSVAVANFKTAANIVRESVSWSSGVNYSYLPAGEVATVGSDKFVYDAVGRLVQAKIDKVQRDYGYDAYGNRPLCNQTDASLVQSPCQTLTSIDNGSNHYNGVSYDAAGNMKNLGVMASDGFSYDALNLMTRAQSDASNPNSAAREFVYTADDERIAVYAVNGTWKWTLRDIAGKAVRELTSSNGSAVGNSGWTWGRDYVYRGPLLLASVQPASNGSGTTTYFYHLDHSGTPRRVTDSNNTIVGSHDYLAFGPEASTSTQESSPAPLKFVGQERDSWGTSTIDALDYMHERYYTPELGRFLSVDPVVPRNAARKHPQRWNRYSYALNDPILFIDPTGLVLDYADKNLKSESERLQKDDSDFASEAQALEVATEVFHVGFTTAGHRGGEEGEFAYNGRDFEISIRRTDRMFSVKQDLAHEFQHAYDYLHRRLGFTLDQGQWKAVFYDINDEVRAFRAAIRASTSLQQQGQSHQEGDFISGYFSADRRHKLAEELYNRGYPRDIPPNDIEVPPGIQQSQAVMVHP